MVATQEGWVQTLRAGNYGFEMNSGRSAYATPFARMRLPFFSLGVLGQNERDGFTAGIVRMLDQMDDAIRAEQIISTTRHIGHTSKVRT